MPLRLGPVEEYPVRPVHYPVPFGYLVENSLDFTRKTVGHTREIYVSGLKDLTVQEKINANLAELYEYIRTGGVPPYRGIRTYIPEGTPQSSITFEASVTFNHNDVLSIVIHYFKEYYTSGPRQQWTVHGMETRNFDLTTGNEIPLSYVFCDDADYLALLGDAMLRGPAGLKATDEGYNMFEWTPALTAPFRGVRAEQVFFLNEGELCLVLDHRTPEFEVPGLGSMSVVLPLFDFPGAVAITKRFYDETADLYIRQGQRALSLPAVHTQNTNRDSEVARYLGETHAYMASYRLPWSATPRVESFVREAFSSYSDVVESFSGLGEGYWAMYRGIYVRQVGEYTMVFVTEAVNNFAEPIRFIEELQWMMHMGDSLHSLREPTYCLSPAGEVLGLADLFAPGFDYQGLIRAAYERVPDYGHVKLPDYDSIAHEITFALEARQIAFRTPHLPTRYDYTQSVRFNITYKDIGYENLTIFSR